MSRVKIPRSLFHQMLTWGNVGVLMVQMDKSPLNYLEVSYSLISYIITLAEMSQLILYYPLRKNLNYGVCQHPFRRRETMRIPWKYLRKIIKFFLENFNMILTVYPSKN